MKKHKKNELTKLILKGLLATGAAVTILALPGIAPALMLFKPKNKYERQRVSDAVRRLERNKFIKIIMDISGDKRVTITNKGVEYLKNIDFEKLIIPKSKKWDGLWRIVIFDIPESRKVARNALNRKLKSLGFYPLQKSTFVFPYNCRKEIEFIRNYFRVKKYVSLLIVNEIEDDKKLHRYFKIK